MNRDADARYIAVLIRECKAARAFIRGDMDDFDLYNAWASASADAALAAVEHARELATR